MQYMYISKHTSEICYTNENDAAISLPSGKEEMLDTGL